LVENGNRKRIPLMRFVIPIKIMAKITYEGNDFDKAREICWRVTLEDAATGDQTRLIIKDGWEEALKYGLKLENDRDGEWILINIENMTMTESTYYLDTDGWKL
jgi:hypothetical protein